MNAGFMAFGVFVASVAYAVFGVVFVRRFLQPHVAAGHNEVLLTIAQIAGTIYAVLLGFLVIVVWQSYEGAHDNLAGEASTLTTMYRETSGMRPLERAKLRYLLRHYTEAVINDEWAIQAASGGASAIARKAVADIYRVVGSLPPAEEDSSINADFLNNFATVASQRNSRTLRAEEKLPWVLWLGLLLGGAMVAGLCFLPRMESLWFHALACSLLGSLIGMLLFIAAVLNQPFTGPMALTAAPFEHSLQVYASVDRGY